MGLPLRFFFNFHCGTWKDREHITATHYYTTPLNNGPNCTSVCTFKCHLIYISSVLNYRIFNEDISSVLFY